MNLNEQVSGELEIKSFGHVCYMTKNDTDREQGYFKNPSHWLITSQ